MIADQIRVLLVEDNPADARLLREAVFQGGAGRIELEHVDRLATGLRRLLENSFDLVLLDLHLPDSHGLETLERAHQAAPNMPIVVLTGMDDEALAIKAMRNGAQDYLVKGQVDGNLLVRAMRYATERKRAIEAVERREEHYRSLFENALDLISILNVHGAIRYASPSHERVLGYRPDELVGRSVLDYVHPDDAETMMTAFPRPDVTNSVEIRFRHKDGSWRVLESMGRNLSDSPVVQGIVVNARDITERKHVEDALREANLTLRAVIQTCPLAIYSTDLEERVKSWNQAAQRMFGWTEGELLGRALPQAIDGEWGDTRRKRAESEESGPAESGPAEAGYEARCHRKDGSALDVTIWSAVLREAGGAVKGIVEVVADITERRRLEEQLRHSQKLEAVGRLAGGVAHDFNNLLMVITGYSEMLLSEMNPADPARGDLGQVLKAAERASDLTRQLLAFSRRQLARPKVLDLNALVTDMHRMLRRVIGEDIELALELAPDLRRVRADPGQLEQVILNLAVNARDAMPRGGTLTVETGQVKPDDEYAHGRGAAELDKYVMLRVADTGVGMDADTKSHLFEPFFTTKEQGKGTGLGLSTSYGIVKQNGGNIWVDSEPGAGTTFQIYLPVADEEAERVESRAESLAPRGRETILLVEDDEAVRRVLEAILRRHGYDVLSSESAPAALEICDRYSGSLDLLITDMVMPLMSGRELAEKLALRSPGLKVLYVSGYNDEGGPPTSGAPSLGGFLQKPFTPETLALRVRDALS
jgi:two-component system cell cycle sensor histidine kinase/response regulator CckA